MTKEEFIAALKRKNPYIDIDEDSIEIPNKEEYYVILYDEGFEVRDYYCERDYTITEYTYAEIETEDDIPDVFEMSDFHKLRDTLIKRMEFIGHDIVKTRVKKLKSLKDLNELLEEIMFNDLFYLKIEILDDTVIKNNPVAFGVETIPGVIYNGNFHTYIIYKDEPELTVEKYKPVIVLGDAKPEIHGGLVIRCFGSSYTTYKDTGYIDKLSDEANVINLL